MVPTRVLGRIGVALVGSGDGCGGGVALRRGRRPHPDQPRIRRRSHPRWAARTPAQSTGPRAASPNAGVSPLALNQQPSLEDHFVPITPCRIADTATAGGNIAAGATRDFQVTGTASLHSQGGSTTGCGIPSNATAVTVYLTGIGTGGTGLLRVWPTGRSTQSVVALRFPASPDYNTGEAVLTLGGGKVTVLAYGHATRVVIDAAGYYVAPIEGLIYTGSTATPTSDGYVYSGSPRLLSVTWLSVGIADVTIDRDVTYCTPIANAYYGDFYYANAKAFNGNKIRVYSWSIDPTTHATAFQSNNPST